MYLIFVESTYVALFIAAVAFVLVGLVYTLVLFSWQWFVIKYSRSETLILFRWMTNTKILAFIDAYHAPYSKEHRYWTGLLILARTMLYFIFAVNVLGDPKVNLLSIICITTILATLFPKGFVEKTVQRLLPGHG